MNSVFLLKASSMSWNHRVILTPVLPKGKDMSHCFISTEIVHVNMYEDIFSLPVLKVCGAYLCIFRPVTGHRYFFNLSLPRHGVESKKDLPRK